MPDLPPRKISARGFDCAGCQYAEEHGRRRRHGVFTDHSIPRARPRLSTARRPWMLRAFSPADAGDRELDSLYAELGVRTGNRCQRRGYPPAHCRAPWMSNCRFASPIFQESGRATLPVLFAPIRAALRKTSERGRRLVNLGTIVRF